MSIAILHGGGRPNGNTETLTKVVTENLPVEEIHLKEYAIEPIVDERHEEEGFTEVKDEYNRIIDRILKHNVIVFSTPIHWFTMTTTMKNFIDRWSQTLKDPNYPHFKEQMAEKKVYVIAVGGDNPYIKGLPLIQQFQHIFDFIGMQFEGDIIGEANRPDQIHEDKKHFSLLNSSIKLYKHISNVSDNIFFPLKINNTFIHKIPSVHKRLCFCGLKVF